jgi:hypothetical protein
MPNINLTHQIVAREAAKILEEEAPFIANINKGRQEEFGEEISGYKPGETVRIKLPPTGRVFNGATFAEGGAATDSNERSINLTLDTQRHIGLQFGAKEKLLEVTDFRERILRPQMRTLSSVVEGDLLARAYQTVPNFVGTAGSVPTTMKVYAQARQKLQESLTPPGDRSVVFSSAANVELVDASRQLFHAASQVERGFLRGSIGEAQGAEFYEHQSIPVHTMGTQTAAMAVNGVTAEGATGIVTDGGTGTNTIRVGTVFTIAGVFSVHPLTGVSTGRLMQFVATATTTLAAGAGTIACFPALRASAPNKTVSALPADNAVVTFLGGSHPQNLMFHKDAFTTAFAPLPVLASCEGYTARLPSGVSVRVMTFGDGNNDYERTRIDVLYGFAAVRPEHACRITE